MTNYTIKEEKGKQPFFGLIYSLVSINLETLKTYIKIYLANNFIWPFKSPTRAPILFDWKLDSSLQLCVNY